MENREFPPNAAANYGFAEGSSFPLDRARFSRQLDRFETASPHDLSPAVDDTLIVSQGRHVQTRGLCAPIPRRSSGHARTLARGAGIIKIIKIHANLISYEID
jgi:hypothetical protein